VSQITVAGDLVSGTYANVNDTGKTGPQIKLRPEHIQALVENVYSDLSRALDEREQGSAAVLDANVADLLGLPEQGVGRKPEHNNLPLCTWLIYKLLIKIHQIDNFNRNDLILQRS